MKYTQSNNQVVNEYIESLDPGVRPLFIKIREEILTISIDLIESIKWKNCLVYSTDKNIIQTVVGNAKVSLIFFGGAKISDPYDLLEGEGKKTRTMRITSADFNVDALREYVSQAIILGAK